MKIIGVTGMRGSGKSVVSEVAQKMGIPSIEMRTVVTEMMKKQGIPINNRSLRDFATDIRKEYGYDVVAKKTIEELETLSKFKASTVIVDGVRSKQEVDLFKKKFGRNFILIAMFAPQKLRFTRVQGRRKGDDPATWEEFLWADEKEKNWGVLEAISQADYVVVNTRSREEVVRQVRDILGKVMD